MNAIFLFNRVKSQDRYFNDVLKCFKYYRNSWTNRFFVLKINEIHIFKRNGQLMIMKAYAAPSYCKNQVKQVLGIHIDSQHSDKTPPVTTSSLKRCVNRFCLGQTRKNSRLRTQVEASVWIEPPSCKRTVGDQPLNRCHKDRVTSFICWSFDIYNYRSDYPFEWVTGKICFVTLIYIHLSPFVYFQSQYC